MYILGLNAFHGDSSAAILKDGVLIAAAEEERFRRIKHWAGFPSEAIKFCLETAGIDATQLDYITISRNPSANIEKKIMHTLKNAVSFKAITDRVKNSLKVKGIKELLAEALNIDVKTIKAEVKNIEHHRSHMASAFFASPFQESAILSIDGFGDFTSTMIGVGKDNKIEVLDSVVYPHSVGIFYTAFTQFLGFPYYGDEYKVMGMAPYGEPKYINEIKDVIIFKDNGLFELNTKYFNHVKNGVKMDWEAGAPHIDAIYSEYMEEKFGKARKKGEELTQYHKDLAASVQKVTEDLIFHILNHLQKQTGSKNICIAGGVAQNSVANGKILEKTNFEQMYIPSAGHDAGTSMGSALYLYNHILGNPRTEPVFNAFTGSAYTNEQIKDFLNAEKIEFRELSDEELYDFVSDRLIAGDVVGWFQGEAEFGPRALGHRSILVDPRRDDAKDLLNEKIKKREKFRPFAPSILREHVKDYFEKDDNVPFMEKVFVIKEDKRNEIKAVTHVDGTGRLQTVSPDNEKYYNLINTFYKKTGTPILLNTSFNENEPIVNTPKEAFACYNRTGMDLLVMGNMVITKKY